jgi:hypothetical protein
LSTAELARLRGDSVFLSGYSKTLVDRAKFKKLLDLKKTNSELKELARARRLGGERLTAAAAVLLITPDPITSAASLPLFAAAQIMKTRRKSSDIGRVFEKVNSDLKDLSTISQLIS